MQVLETLRGHVGPLEGMIFGNGHLVSSNKGWFQYNKICTTFTNTGIKWLAIPIWDEISREHGEFRPTLMANLGVRVL